MNNATGKRVLALVRGDDYAHPGEEEANGLLFAGLVPDRRRRVLDAGCGGAGTAAWARQRGLGAVTGIEIDPATAELGRRRHPDVTIVQGDLQRASRIVDGPFDLMYAMTAVYAVPDQDAVFRELALLAAAGAELRLLEYADPHGHFAAATGDSATLAWWRPLVPLRLPETLAAAGWSSVCVRDLHPEFIAWYTQLCARIHDKRDRIRREFGDDWYAFVAAEYAGILELVRERALGGVLVRAKRGRDSG